VNDNQQPEPEHGESADEHQHPETDAKKPAAPHKFFFATDGTVSVEEMATLLAADVRRQKAELRAQAEESNSKDPFRTDVVFLALLRDRQPSEGATLNGYFENLNSVYLINPTDHEVRATTSASGFFSDDELGVLIAPSKQTGEWIVAAQGFVCIENPSDDELDEVVCSWSILIESHGQRITRSFSAGKRREDTIFCSEIPILGKPGLLIAEG
jgi:hypothetical protein